MDAEPDNLLKTNYQIADEVIEGIWGEGVTRIDRLKDAGYCPGVIQILVDKKLGG